MIVQGLERLVLLLAHLEWHLDGVLFTALLLCVAACSLAWLVTSITMSRLPPGPWSGMLPIVGYLPFIGRDPHLELSRLASVHGPIFRISLGSKLVVVLADPTIIRDAFRREAFAGRPHTEFTQILGGYGIVNTEGERWKEQRRFIHEKLRNFGAGRIGGQNRDTLERRITQEVHILMRVMSETRGEAFDIQNLLASSLSNVICSLLMGVRFGHRDPCFLRFLHLMDEGLRLFALTAPVNFIAGLRFVPGINWAYRQIIKNRDEMFVFFREQVDHHKRTFEADKCRDLIDAYLLEMQKRAEEPKPQTKCNSAVPRTTTFFCETQLYQVIGDLFSAGLEPVKDTIQWAVLYMMTHPEVQTRVQEELDEVVGTRRLPSLHDFPFLPYTEATIMEVQRLANVLAIGTSRCATENTTLCGYTIPKGTHVLPLLWAVHMDPNRWSCPDVFDPSRFIDKTGRIIKPDNFIPFSTGRRMCLGDSLARMEIFLIFACVLHQFHLRVPDGEPAPSLDGVMQITRTPSHFKVSATLRRPHLCTEDFYGDS